MNVRGTAGRDAWLDGLRALAALMVFVHHATPGTYLGGWDAGVLVFFTLSGYLLYRPFLQGPVDVRAYAIRRVLRIYPAYLVAAVGIAVLNGYDLDPMGVITMGNTTVIVAWTLQIEVVFYLLLPLIAWIAHGQRPALLAMAAISLSIGAAELIGTHVFPGAFATWAWAFVPGMILAQVAVTRPDLLRRASSWVVPLAGLCLLAISVVPDIKWPDIPSAAGSALLLAWLLTRPAPSARIAGVMLVGGALSYSFYLWHEALMAVDRPVSPVGILLALLISGSVAAVSYVVVERPAIQLARRLTTRRVPQAASAPAAVAASSAEA